MFYQVETSGRAEVFNCLEKAIEVAKSWSGNDEVRILISPFDSPSWLPSAKPIFLC